MPAYQLHAFLTALRSAESGGQYANIAEDGRRGAYGITPDNWQRWTSQLGLTGAPWQDKDAQDMVARKKATELYDRYGDWKLVALAWWGGTEFADEAAARGADPTIPMMDEASKLTVGLGSTIQPKREAPTGDGSQPTSEPQADTQLTRAIRASGKVRPVVDVKNAEMHHLVAPILQGLSNSIRASAARGEGIPDAGSTNGSAGDGLPSGAPEGYTDRSSG